MQRLRLRIIFIHNSTSSLFYACFTNNQGLQLVTRELFPDDVKNYPTYTDFDNKLRHEHVSLYSVVYKLRSRNLLWLEYITNQVKSQVFLYLLLSFNRNFLFVTFEISFHRSQLICNVFLLLKAKFSILSQRFMNTMHLIEFKELCIHGLRK